MKIAIVEAIRFNHKELVDLLLLYQAQTQKASVRHKKTPLEWARAVGNTSIANMIRERNQINSHVDQLFKSISKHDIDAVLNLTEGGTRYEWNQDEKFRRALKEKLNNTNAKERVRVLMDELTKTKHSRDYVFIEIGNREKKIERLQSMQREIGSTRLNETKQALSKVWLAATENNILAVLNMEKPSVECIMIAKGICTLLQQGSLDNIDFVYWQHFKRLLSDKTAFYNRLWHFCDKAQALIAANVKVDGASITCAECVNSICTRGAEPILITSLMHWLDTIFRSAPSHELENDLITQENIERSLLERKKIDADVISSRCTIISREIAETNKSIALDSEMAARIERQIEMSNVMKVVTETGHTVLSWAMSAGNKAIARIVLANGAHTGIGEECISWCASIIQICFRRYSIRKIFNEQLLHPMTVSCERRFEHNSRCLAMSMRISSLSKLVRRRFSCLRLPLLEALFNGHSELVDLLRSPHASNELSLFHAVNIATMFCLPCAAIPRYTARGLPNSKHNLVSAVSSCVQFEHDKDSKSCVFVNSFRCAVELTDEHLMRQKHTLEAKIATRQETIFRKRRALKFQELRSAMFREDFAGMVESSKEGCISLDCEDDDTHMTPLILAAIREENKNTDHELQLHKEPVSAVAYLLDRISPYKPTLCFETAMGSTALSAACTHGRTHAISELLIRGANINQQSTLTGHSALMSACLVGKLDVVKLLIHQGANVDLKDNLGCTAYDLAIQKKHRDVSEYLSNLET
ncbi:hypothetical protein HJC23_003124 [Cyclotella cryptica]|uniref:ANK_REP_REGION domain-containing protein n=1 Tax=Cyclotella cryptica TaxID=29204 RepID=A0ABD3P4Z4_9STRA